MEKAASISDSLGAVIPVSGHLLSLVVVLVSVSALCLSRRSNSAFSPYSLFPSLSSAFACFARLLSPRQHARGLSSLI